MSITLEVSFMHLSEEEQFMALSLLDQAKKLRKVCPKWRGGACSELECPDGTHAPASQCRGTGLIPVEPEDAEVVVK
jgi:hypothetical protein